MKYFLKILASNFEPSIVFSKDMAGISVTENQSGVLGTNEKIKVGSCFLNVKERIYDFLKKSIIFDLKVNPASNSDNLFDIIDDGQRPILKRTIKTILTNTTNRNSYRNRIKIR